MTTQPNNDDTREIGRTADVQFETFNKKHKGLVDTGSDYCSLHCDSFKITKNPEGFNLMVLFKSPLLSNNVIQVPLKDQMVVHSSDGGEEIRPIIELNILVNDVVCKDVLFNLNDRSRMEYPILIGMNCLKQGKFTINTVKEDVELEIDTSEVDDSTEEPEEPEDKHASVEAKLDEINHKLDQLLSVLK